MRGKEGEEELKVREKEGKVRGKEGEGKKEM